MMCALQSQFIPWLRSLLEVLDVSVLYLIPLLPVVQKDVWDPEIPRLDHHAVHAPVLARVPG